MVKKDSLIKGTIILAAAALVARVLGLFQRIPLDYMMGSQGGVYFGIANSLYLLLLLVATGGIPSAISKMVSERYALGKPREAQRIYGAALRFGMLAGVIMASLMFLLAPLYAEYVSKEEGADLSIMAIAPALLLFPVIAMMRGYFQGRQMMAAGGISQIIEQIARVLTAVGLALIVLNWGWGDRWIAAAAAFGSVFGSIGAFAIMVYYARKLRLQDAAEPPVSKEIPGAASALSYRSIYREMFSISVPIVVAAITVQFMYNFDTNLFHMLTDSFYGGKDAAREALDWLAIRAQSLAGIPPILAIALSTSIIPVISAAFSVRNMDEVERQTSLVMRIVVFTGVPAALTLTVAAVSVTGFFFEGTGGSGLVAALTAGTIFQITMMTSNSVLFGMGKARIPMRHTIVGLVVKVVGSLALAPLLGAYGLIIASTLCFIVISTLNLRAVGREVRHTVLGSRWGGYLITIAASAGAGYAVDLLARSVLDGLPDKVTYFFAAAATGIAALAVYAVLLVVLRVIRPEEIKQFPGPIRKLLVPLMRLAPKHASSRG
ncbi:putative polysaccharide biosynthesis protein [Paenibacillus xanthanilyticus]|uniref:Oligosaccharide flippase family protein n=1 Tax=Paenibacillus xanthanilyticus TaxID=1783531 RepID=A0ABV8KAI5_9BACL